MDNSNRTRLKLLRAGVCMYGRSFVRWLALAADPLSKWAAIIAVLAGGAWALYRFGLSGATDWAINLSISTQVIPYHDDLALLVIHVHPKNPRDQEVNLDPGRDAYKVTVEWIPDGKPIGTVMDDNLPASGVFPATISMMPKDGYTFLPGADFDDATSIVVPMGSKLWITAEVDYEGDYVVANSIVVIPGRSSARGGAAK